MTDKPDDPLAGGRTPGLWCEICSCFVPNHQKKEHADDKHDEYEHYRRLLPEHAVRAAMVEWLKERSKRKLQESMNLWNSKKPLDQANKRDKAFALSEASTECYRIADRLEAGGGGDAKTK